jgi:DNA-binding NtrC family response regulator
MQVKLLRILQDLEFEQVGGTKTFHVDTRVILATNDDLGRLVAEGKFRQDLFYRINVINVELPPLRDRIGDIPLLAEHFLRQVCEDAGKQVAGFTAEATNALRCYRWPGNVRELQNVIERAVLLGKESVIGVADLPNSLATVGSVNVINVELPPLRDRISDIPLLAEHFLRQVCDDSGKSVRGFTDNALAALERYRWPGNVRELENVIERAVLLGKESVIGVDDLPPALTASGNVNVESISGRSLKQALESPERQIIREVLESHNWNRNDTAEARGINRTTLYKKMKRLGLEDMAVAMGR